MLPPWALALGCADSAGAPAAGASSFLSSGEGISTEESPLWYTLGSSSERAAATDIRRPENASVDLMGCVWKKRSFSPNIGPCPSISRITCSPAFAELPAARVSVSAEESAMKQASRRNRNHASRDCSASLFDVDGHLARPVEDGDVALYLTQDHEARLRHASFTVVDDDIA
jgi:hypothetical protein